MKKLLTILFLATLSASAATVTGTLTDVGIGALQTRITFTPTNAVQSTDTGLLVGMEKIIKATNGTFSVVLETGKIKVSFPDIPSKLPFYINVPNTNASYDIRNLATNLVTYAYTNDPSHSVKATAGDTTPGFLTNKLVAGENITLTTTNSGKQIIISATGGTIIDTNAFVQTNDSRLADSRAPTGTAGGDLTGTFPNPTLSATAKNNLTNDIVSAVAANTASIASVVAAAITNDYEGDLIFTNSTPGNSGSASDSPSLIQSGNAWIATSDESFSVRFRNYVDALQDNSAVKGTWRLQSSVEDSNGSGVLGPWADVLTVTESGVISGNGSHLTNIPASSIVGNRTNLVSVDTFVLQNINDPVAGVFFTNDVDGLKIFSADDRNPENLWATITPTGFKGGGSGITSLNASNLSSGTIPDARFPATLPAASGANLTSLNAANLTGIVPSGSLSATAQSANAILTSDGTNRSWTNAITVSSLTLGTSGTLSGGVNAIEEVNGTNAMVFKIYNTRTDTNNYELGGLSWSRVGGQMRVFTESAGTGVARGLTVEGASYVGLSAKNSTVRILTASSGNADSWNFSNTSLLAMIDNGCDIGDATHRPRFLTIGSNILSSGLIELKQIGSGGTPSTDSARLYAKDNSGTAEIFVKDEAGNETQISPHAADAPASLYDDSDEMPFITRESNDFTGKGRWINHSREARRTEQLLNAMQVLITLVNTNGMTPLQLFRLNAIASLTAAQKDIISVSNNFVAPVSWKSVQDAHQATYDARRADELAQYNTPVTNIVDGATNISAVNTNIVVRPDIDVRKPIPAWLKARGVTN